MNNHVLPLVLLLLVGCYDDIDIDQLCLPSDEGCESFDYDGDGVANGSDDFPEDATCAVRDDANCTACGEGCTEVQVCDGAGACVCEDPLRALPECTSCLPQFAGENCEECTDPLRALPECTSCLPQFTGENCEACTDPKYTGESCDECSDSHYALPDCTSCRPEFTGANCEECSDPEYTGFDCDECSTGFHGPGCAWNCDNGFIGPECDEVTIPPTTFTMGSPPTEPCREGEEVRHEVTLTRSFSLKATEVTQGEWEALMGNNPSQKSLGCEVCPVETVTWYEALAYCNALSIAVGLEACYTLNGCSDTVGNGMVCSDVTLSGLSGTVYDCEGYRLPTEAEWEVAVRASTTSATFAGDIDDGDCYSISPVLESIAWYSENSNYTTYGVAQRNKNPWGLYDILGNVWEWTWDRYAAYPGDLTNPVGPSSGSSRVIRGCSWSSAARYCRAASRSDRTQRDRHGYLGFRVARTLPD